MAQGLFNYPQPTKERGQRALDIADLYLTKFTPPWARPPSFSAYQWRAWVLNQPVAIVCRETLVANVLALDWKITPRNSKYRETLEPTIRYYTRLFEKGGDYGSLSLDYSGLVEWIVGDLLDTPFGSGAEIGRKGDEPGGRVVWIRPLDAGTLFPTLNSEYPVVQYWAQPYDAVAFPYWAISRSYMSPHQFIYREGWGMAPPEKVYFALELLNRGDKYYANLLLDVPTAGILDLGDIEKDSAMEWISSFKEYALNQDLSFRIPVLYEHYNDVKFLPFGKVPNDLMFDKITLKYAALVAAGYGMSLSDIGLQTTTASGETLAGSIRQERRTRRTGLSRIKAKVKAFFDKILPETLEFSFVDYDDEVNVALGRARLASSQAFAFWQDKGILSPQEIRSQLIQDGLVSISMPDEIPGDVKPAPQTTANGEPELLQGGKPPSAGGEGEVKSLVDTVSFKVRSRSVNHLIENIVSQITPKICGAIQGVSEDELVLHRSLIAESFFQDEDELEINLVLAQLLKNKSLGSLEFGDVVSELKAWLEAEGIEYTDSLDLEVEEFKSRVKGGLKDFLGKSILFILNDVIFEQSMFDGYTEETYNNINQIVRERVEKTLPEFVKAHVGIELQKMIERIKEK